MSIELPSHIEVSEEVVSWGIDETDMANCAIEDGQLAESVAYTVYVVVVDGETE